MANRPKHEDDGPPNPAADPPAAPHRSSPRDGPHPLDLHLLNMMLTAKGETALLEAALEGLTCYRTHSFRRVEPERPAIACEGATRLIDYGGQGPSVLLVPSLVNPAWILDLLPGASLAQDLKAGGLRPLLLDWGAPGEAERRFGLADYVERLLRLAARAVKADGDPLRLVGYCMGGTLAAAAAVLRPDLFERLALLAAPWDFHAAAGTHRALALAALPLVPLIEAIGEAPPALVQAYFAALSPESGLHKFVRFARMDPDCDAARRFVALEDWNNGGDPLAARVALEVLRDWYALNLPGSGAWHVAGRRIDPARLGMPLLAAVPLRDRVVPPASALGLAGGLRAVRLLRPESGHVGMIVGHNAAQQLRRPLADWLAGGL